MDNDYTVTVANTFEAESIADAVKQMAAWISDHAYAAGYRISWEEVVDGVRQERSVFADASFIVEGDM